MGWPSISGVTDALSTAARAARDTVAEGVDTVASAASSATSAIGSTVSNGVAAVRETADRAVTNVEGFGAAALDRAGDLASAGLDAGRRGVEAVRNVDVRAAAATVREAIGTATEAGRTGITDATHWAGERVGDGADWARSHVSGDDPASQAFRGVVTQMESSTRFQLGVTGGIVREVVGTVGAAGQLAVTGAEMQVSQEARVEYSTAIANGVVDAGRAAGGYVAAVAEDPGRLAQDAEGAWNVTSGFVSSTADRYGQAIADGRMEEIGMDVGTVATYVVPVGGGPVRGALTAAVREGGEVLARTGVSALARGGAEAAVREGGLAVLPGAAGTVERQGAALLDRAAAGGGATQAGDIAAASRQTGREVALYRDAATGERRVTMGKPAAADAGRSVAGDLAATADAAVGPVASGRGVFFVDDAVVPYLDKADASLGRPGAHFFMPLEDSGVVVDAASAYRYTGGAPSLERAYTGGGDVFGVEFPLQGMTPRVPTAVDSGGFTHYLEGGHTALRLGDGGGFLINPTREFVVPGGIPMPEGSTLFRLGEDGARIPMRSW